MCKWKAAAAGSFGAAAASFEILLRASRKAQWEEVVMCYPTVFDLFDFRPRKANEIRASMILINNREIKAARPNMVFAECGKHANERMA
jgi:hypothetical protein